MTEKNQTKTTHAKHTYTVRVFGRNGAHDLGEYPSKAAAKRAMEQLRATEYPHRCMRIIEID